MRRSTLWILTVVALGAALIFGPCAYAQSQSSGSTGSGQQAVSNEQAMSRDLKLTEDQKNQLKSINEQRRQDIQAVAQDKSLMGEQRAQRIREINRGANSQIGSLMTPEQRNRWERRWRDRREDVRDRREDRRDRKEDVRDRREDIRDRREDVRDAKHDGGRRDRIEDRRDRREDVRDRREDRRDRKEDVRDRREDRRDRRTPPPPPRKRR